MPALVDSAQGHRTQQLVGSTQRTIYTVIKNCRRCSLDPFAYMRDILTRLPNMTNYQIPEVIPQAWLGEPKLHREGCAKAKLQVQRQAVS